MMGTKGRCAVVMVSVKNSILKYRFILGVISPLHRSSNIDVSIVRLFAAELISAFILCVTNVVCLCRSVGI